MLRYQDALNKLSQMTGESNPDLLVAKYLESECLRTGRGRGAAPSTSVGGTLCSVSVTEGPGDSSTCGRSRLALHTSYCRPASAPPLPFPPLPSPLCPSRVSLPCLLFVSLRESRTVF